MKVDSGAIDTRTSKEVGRAFPLKETPASKAGMKHEAANGTEIRNYGERDLQGVNEDWSTMGMTAQVADVQTTFASVHCMFEANTRVALDSAGS